MLETSATYVFDFQVLEQFIRLHDFSNINLVSALRVFLMSFRLPGEVQKIDRMMEKFAQAYCAQIPATRYTEFNNTLHNRAVKRSYKQTVEHFMNLNRGINGGDDLPCDMVMEMYESIKAQQFKVTVLCRV